MGALSKIKGEWEQDRPREGEWETDVMEIMCVFDCDAEQAESRNLANSLL